MKQVYHIVYASDHNFIFPCAVSMLSLATSVAKDNSVIIHLLADDSLTEADQNLLKIITERQPTVQIKVHEIKNEMLDKLDCSYTYLNKMTLYRLLLPELLSDVDVCLYLDADTFVWRDIIPIFEVDIDGYFLAGVVDEYIAKEFDEYCPEGLEDKSGYVNAGVLLMNLSIMRDENLQPELLSKVQNGYLYNDQDILNICCYGRIRHLDEKYNCFSYRERTDVTITHFVSQFGTRPWDYPYAKYADTWWQMAGLFRDTIHYKNYKQQAKDKYNMEGFNRVVSICQNSNEVFIWGSGKYGKKLLRCLVKRHGIIPAGVFDNNEEKRGTRIDGIPVVALQDVTRRVDAIILISNQKKENVESIKKQLNENGWDPTKTFQYQFISPVVLERTDPKYRDKFKDELWMEYECVLK